MILADASFRSDRFFGPIRRPIAQVEVFAPQPPAPLNAFVHLSRSHSSLPSPSSAPVLMPTMSLISRSLTGIGAQASPPRVQTMMPSLSPSWLNRSAPSPGGRPSGVLGLPT